MFCTSNDISPCQDFVQIILKVCSVRKKDGGIDANRHFLCRAMSLEFIKLYNKNK